MLIQAFSTGSQTCKLNLLNDRIQHKIFGLCIKFQFISTHKIKNIKNIFKKVYFLLNIQIRKTYYQLFITRPLIHFVLLWTLICSLSLGMFFISALQTWHLIKRNIIKWHYTNYSKKEKKINTFNKYFIYFQEKRHYTKRTFSLFHLPY